jgi:hypothetical protein
LILVIIPILATQCFAKQEQEKPQEFPQIFAPTGKRELVVFSWKKKFDFQRRFKSAAVQSTFFPAKAKEESVS